MHICFGYAAIIHQRPSGYSFLPELAACSCQQVSIETAQANLDCSVLSSLTSKKIMVGCVDLSDMTVETPQQVVARIKRAIPFVPKENIILAPDCGMKYLPRERAFAKLEAARQQLDLFRDALIPQTELSYQAALAAYEVGRVEFISLMEAARAIRDVRLGYYRALVDVEQRFADLERAVGRDLIQ